MLGTTLKETAKEIFRGGGLRKNAEFALLHNSFWVLSFLIVCLTSAFLCLVHMRTVARIEDTICGPVQCPMPQSSVRDPYFTLVMPDPTFIACGPGPMFGWFPGLHFPPDKAQ